MKHTKLIAMIAFLGIAPLLLSGCGTMIYPGGPTPMGVVYTNVSSPAQMLSVSLDETAQSIKKGSASTKAYFGMFAVGNGSIDEAMRNGGITRIHHIDHQLVHFLNFFYVRNTTIVYGE